MHRQRSAFFAARDLVKAGDAYAWPWPPGVGAHVRLNSGGPAMLIVDIEGDVRVCATVAGLEHRFAWQCLRPASAAAADD